MIIFPSPLEQDPNKLQSIITTLDPFCAGYHIDIMDGIFVKNKMGSIQLTNHIATMTHDKLWVHLMVKDPEPFIKELKIPEGSIISFHYEAVELEQAEAYAALIQKKNMIPSLAINPKTQIHGPLCLAHSIHHFLLMGVEPGASGQKFIPKTIEKLQELDIHRKAQGSDFSLAVDGGINKRIIEQLKPLDIDHIAITSALFDDADPIAKLKELQSI